MNLDRIVQEIRHGALAAAIFVGSIVPPVIDAQGGAGAIAGVITTTAAALTPLHVTMDQHVCGNQLADEAIVIDGAGHLANAVVTVAGVKSSRGATTASVMNEKCRFSPRVQVVRPHATITTSSKDPMLHTTNATMDNGKGLWNVAVPVPGIKIPKPIAGPGLVRLTCNTHPWMRGYIVVTDEIATVSGADGKFMLQNVPPGAYELRVWHETLKAVPQKVTVVAGQTAMAHFELK